MTFLKTQHSIHIVIDLQGAQSSGSRNRGIGRYSESLALSLARLAQGRHRVSLALNGAFADTIDPILETFADLVDLQNIHVWRPLTPAHAHDKANVWRRAASEALYESFLKRLEPDIVLVTSLFEGFHDDAIISIKQRANAVPTAVVLYDLIPFIQRKVYLQDPSNAAWYHNRIGHLSRADVLLAISESCRQESIDYLGSEPQQVVNISSAIGTQFCPMHYAPEDVKALCTHYGLLHPFIMYTGGIDHRKNIEGLIVAYASLTQKLRQTHQLAVVCSISEHDRKRLHVLAKQHGLEANELVLTGFVPDADLLALYNLCTLFVFPSWHEGFGLPVLEAMACGAPALASNRSSLPEVVGWNEALFDPFDIQDIARAIERGLTDSAFRAELKAHALRQAAKFSWEATAARALAALEHLCARPQPEHAQQAIAHRPALPLCRPRLAYVSPLQSAQSGISDYSAELLPVLAAYYDIDVIVEQIEPVTDPWVLGNARQRSVAWFEQHAPTYDRVLYHFGNSHFHRHMFTLLERYPGIVVLHDFFLGNICAHMDVTSYAPGVWTRALLHAHGWNALQHRFSAEDAADVVYKWPCNLDVLQLAQGVIIHTNYSRRLAREWYGPSFGQDWALIPHLRVPVADKQRSAARSEIGLSDDVFLVCSFGLLGPTKLNHCLVEAWLASSLARDQRCKLVFIGQASGEYDERMRQLLRAGAGRITITGWADETTYRHYLAAADMAVQLRTLSRGETSGTVLDCMNYGVPTIVNANGSMADLPIDTVCMLEDDFTTGALQVQLERLYADSSERKALGTRAAAHIRIHHKPSHCAAQYAQAIEHYYAKAEQQGALGLVQQIRRIGAPQYPSDLATLAERMANIYPPLRPLGRQLLVDISELHQQDAKSGIQRVVRSVLHALLRNPPEGFRVEPVYATAEQGYRYARRYTARFLGLGDIPLDDAPIFTEKGDVFWGLDLNPILVHRNQSTLGELRLRGVKMVFTVYDLLPIRLPETCALGGTEWHGRWLQTLAHTSDGLLCISASVGTELKRWLTLFGPQEGHAVNIGWTRLGADVVELEDTQGETIFHPDQVQAVQLAAIARHPSFLMVGTLEPRKAQAQALAAFEFLWSQGEQINLVFVGKQGWLVDELAQHLRSHPLRERRVFWLEGIPDAMLERVYAACTCLIAASLDEGYGLPLIEAARHNVPILARDIPVFREVAGEHASYFSGLAPNDLAQAVTQWLKLYQQDKAPCSNGISWLTWKQATAQMLNLILNEHWQSRWEPARDTDLVARYWGSDPRLFTQVGKYEGIALASTGVPGHLLHGPYINLKAGNYVVSLKGKVGLAGIAGARADVCISGGQTVLAEQALFAPPKDQEGSLAELHFILDQPCQRLEVRIEVGETSDLYLNFLEIRRDARASKVDNKAIGTWVTPSQSEQVVRRTCAYWASHPRMQTQVGYPMGRGLATTGKEGALLYGPYISLPAGSYVATVLGEGFGRQGLDEAYWDVTWSKGAVATPPLPLNRSRGGKSGELGNVRFDLTSFADEVEVRLFVGAKSNLRVDGIKIVELDAAADACAGVGGYGTGAEYQPTPSRTQGLSDQ